MSLVLFKYVQGVGSYRESDIAQINAHSHAHTHRHTHTHKTHKTTHVNNTSLISSIQIYLSSLAESWSDDASCIHHTHNALVSRQTQSSSLLQGPLQTAIRRHRIDGLCLSFSLFFTDLLSIAICIIFTSVTACDVDLFCVISYK
jgi:hypothetical protein